MRASASRGGEGRRRHLRQRPQLGPDPQVFPWSSHGPVTVDVAFGGAMYAPRRLPLWASTCAGDYNALISVGRGWDQLNDSGGHRASTTSILSDVYGTALHGSRIVRGPHHLMSPSSADGEVDRSPCGSGTAARLALGSPWRVRSRRRVAPRSRSSARLSPVASWGDHSARKAGRSPR